MTKNKHFSEFWDKIHNVEFAKERALMVLKLIKEHCPKTQNVLELGVGTGNVLKHFKDTLNVHGIDIEQEYIDLCKQKIPKGNFFVQRMENFDIDKKFDVIFCVYDSINFLEDLNQWEQTFDTVKKHLSKDGIFIFDMYLPIILKEYEEKVGWHQEFDFGLVTSTPIVKGNYLQWKLKIIEKNKPFFEHVYDFWERIYSVKDVSPLIKKRFKILHKQKITDDKRILFVCK
jgi:SAM-dependent methyltransferase